MKKPDERLLENLTEHARQELLALERERAARSLESLKLYKPFPKQRIVHESPAKEIIVIGGNRGGKTTACAVEMAWALTGTHPVKGRYPERDGRAMIMCANWRHVGGVIVPALIKAGAIKCIKDLDSGLWRAVDYEKDQPRKAEWKPAPPLVPPRLIANQSWLLKSASQLTRMELHNGWVLDIFSSEGQIPQGFSVDLAWLDEDIPNPEIVGEVQARLADRSGRLIFSAMPHSQNDALLGLCERADKAAESGLENPPIIKVVLRFLDNSAIPEESRKLMIERWAAQGDEVLRMRSEGEFTHDSILMYPTFNMGIHGYPRKLLPNGQVPEEWTRYAIIDPGHAICAVLFAAVSPDEKTLLLYDELYIAHATAISFGNEMKKKCQGQRFYAFLIDAHGARLRDIGGGRTPQEQYQEQLELHGISSAATGSSFIPGTDDVLGGIESVRLAMHIRPDGTPLLRVLEGALPNFQREIKRFRRMSTVVGGQTIIQDKPHPKAISHLMDCMRYICAYEPRYHKPESIAEKPWWWDWKQARDRKKAQEGVVYLSPSSYATETYVA